VLATSGIDYDIKIWAPLSDFPHHDAERAETVRLLEKLYVYDKILF